MIDLSEVTWVEPYAVVYLGMYLRHHNDQGRFFDVGQVGAKVHKYLEKQNFWNRFNFALDPANDRQLMRSYQTTSFGDIIDIERTPRLAEQINDKLIELLERQSVHLAIEECVIAVTELVDNFSQHSSVVLGAMMVQYYPTKHELRIALADCGKGIKNSLLESGKYPDINTMSHGNSILQAFQPQITCKFEGGMGFCDILDTVRNHNGSLFLTSFDGSLFVDTDGNIYVMDVPYCLPGVQAELTFYER